MGAAALGEAALRGSDPRGVSETCSVQSQEQLGELCTLTGEDHPIAVPRLGELQGYLVDSLALSSHLLKRSFGPFSNGGGVFRTSNPLAGALAVESAASARRVSGCAPPRSPPAV